MIEAIERQEQDEAARELGFLDRLALLMSTSGEQAGRGPGVEGAPTGYLRVCRRAADQEDIDYRRTE